MTVLQFPWGASEAAIRAACNLAGHEPKATRQRREPVAPIDYIAEAEAFRAEARRAKRESAAVLVLADIRAARQRERDDPDGISTHPTTATECDSVQVFNKWR